MSCDLTVRRFRLPVHRVARGTDAWAWRDWSHAAEDGTFGNRWDDPLGSYRTLYACRERLGAFVETLARFRPDPEVVAGLAKIRDDGGEVVQPPGYVPSSWLRRRVVGAAIVHGSFAAVGEARSLAFLRTRMADALRRWRVRDLDASSIRLTVPREFTQEVSRVVYECTTERGTRVFAGITYRSKLGDEFTNLAVFEPARLDDLGSRPIRRDDPDLLEASAILHLTLYDE